MSSLRCILTESYSYLSLNSTVNHQPCLTYLCVRCQVHESLHHMPCRCIKFLNLPLTTEQFSNLDASCKDQKVGQKLQLFIQLSTMPWQCFLQEEIFTESKHSLEWDLTFVSSLWGSTHRMLGLMLLEEPELLPWRVLCFSKVWERLE